MIQRSGVTSQRKAPSHCPCRRMNMPPTSTGRKPGGRPLSGSPTLKRRDVLLASAEFFENLFVVLTERGRRRVDAWAAVRKDKSCERHPEIAVHSVAARVAMDNLAAQELRIGHRLAHGTHPRRR